MLLPVTAAVGTARERHRAAQTKGGLGRVGKLNTFVSVVGALGVLQTPASATRKNRNRKNLTLVRRDR